MIKIIAPDIDGILLFPKFPKILEKSNAPWLSKTFPVFKKSALRAVELAEFITGIKYKVNQPLIDFLNDLRAGNGYPHIFLHSDRTAMGVKNVWKELSGLNLGEKDCVQIRGKKDERKKKNGIKKFLGTEAEILISPFIKPDKAALYPLMILAKEKGINPVEVLVIDDNHHFLKSARKLGFKIFPNLFINNNQEEAPDIFLHLLKNFTKTRAL